MKLFNKGESRLIPCRLPVNTSSPVCVLKTCLCPFNQLSVRVGTTMWNILNYCFRIWVWFENVSDHFKKNIQLINPYWIVLFKETRKMFLQSLFWLSEVQHPMFIVLGERRILCSDATFSLFPPMFVGYICWFFSNDYSKYYFWFVLCSVVRSVSALKDAGKMLCHYVQTVFGMINLPFLKWPM